MKTEQREEGTAAFSTAPTIVATMAWFSTYLGGAHRDAGAGGHMDVRDEPERHEYRHRDLVHRGCGL